MEALLRYCLDQLGPVFLPHVSNDTLSTLRLVSRGICLQATAPRFRGLLHFRHKNFDTVSQRQTSEAIVRRIGGLIHRLQVNLNGPWTPRQLSCLVRAVGQLAHLRSLSLYYPEEFPMDQLNHVLVACSPDLPELVLLRKPFRYRPRPLPRLLNRGSSHNHNHNRSVEDRGAAPPTPLVDKPLPMATEPHQRTLGSLSDPLDYFRKIMPLDGLLGLMLLRNLTILRTKGLDDHAYLCILAGCPDLEGVHLFDASITDVTLRRYVNRRHHARRCTKIDISYTPNITDAGILDLLAGSPSTTELCLTDCPQLKGEFLTGITPGQLANLTGLYLQGEVATPPYSYPPKLMDGVFAHSWPHLRKVILCKVAITDLGIVGMASNCPLLRVVELRDCRDAPYGSGRV
ncbi:hypothetical protein H4R33_000730 [Dimargaris cristalligena]|nr:hypothetical protein H4R33_000730 [Dimargaris cristalligena]